MSYTRLPSDLGKRLRAAGFTVNETPGWATRGRPATTGGFAPVGVLCHHTATGKSTSDAAVINLLIHGRSDLPGPLCQLGLGRDGTVHLIAAGRANHAGEAKASGSVAGGDGNSLYIGIEAFHAGPGEPWTEAQRDTYARLCAWLSVNITGSSAQSVRAHKETSVTGKIDPTFDMDAFRAQVAADIKKLTQPPKPAVQVPADAVRVPVWHISMQFSDTHAQHQADAAKLFARAEQNKVGWITGTEAGGGSKLRQVLSWAAAQYGYRLHAPEGQDAWIAVRADLIAGGWDAWYSGTIVEGVAKQYTNKGVVSVSFETTRFGLISVIATHYLTKGRPDSSDPALRANLPENRKLAAAVGARAEVLSKGRALVFYGGDQNIPDSKADTFLGKADLTSVQDELGLYEGTGHGPIDVIASHDEDGRVLALGVQVDNDREFFLHTDHFLLRALFAIRPLRKDAA